MKKDERMIWDKLFFWGFALVGLVIGGYLIYEGWSSVKSPDVRVVHFIVLDLSANERKYCLVFEDNFSNGIDGNNWNYEISVGGFGDGSFDWTTNDPKNAYTDDKGLHIVPTITTEATNITNEHLLTDILSISRLMEHVLVPELQIVSL